MKRENRTTASKAIIGRSKYNSTDPNLSYRRGTHNTRLNCHISTTNIIRLPYKVLPSKIVGSFPLAPRVREIATISAWSVAYKSVSPTVGNIPCLVCKIMPSSNHNIIFNKNTANGYFSFLKGYFGLHLTRCSPWLTSSYANSKYLSSISDKFMYRLVLELNTAIHYVRLAPLFQGGKLSNIEWLKRKKTYNVML